MRIATTALWCVAVLVVSTQVEDISSSKILLIPYIHQQTSRLMNMVKIGQMLSEHNHDVAMLLPSNCVPKNVPEKVRTITFKLDTFPFEISEETFLHEMRKDPFVFMSGWIEYSRDLLDSLFNDSGVMLKMVSEEFDLVFMDVISPQGLIVRDYLDIPGVGYSNLGFGNDRYFSSPLNPSYVPSPTGKFSDRMDFWERLTNALSILGARYVTGKMRVPFSEAKLKYNLNTSLSLWEAQTRLSLVIVNVDFVFDYPRPVMPWVKPVSGLLFHPAKPLPEELERFVQSSGEHGIIIMSFGTMIAGFSSETMAMIARVFARLPQKVILRNAKSNVQGLGNNTKVLPWIPQNDLLGHEKARLFITHCGVSSSHEALFHGVPVIAVPLFFDQFSHAKKLVQRIGMGEELDFYNLTEQAFEAKIKSVLTNPSYYESAKRASALVRDQPMNGKEMMRFWIEYVIRNKGTMHFHSQAMERLNWFQYLLLDVMGFIIITTFCGLIVIWIICKFVLCSLVPKIYRRKPDVKTKGE
ncbi:UDP-glucuronosyltransferase 2B1-like [Lingula anatina]|uniref:UDP-glucuronosyltransferase n=1 Tax=Lingula anatina TaxID=7574 RepID=A0A1S3H0Q2_LINAN|nr:UDP-glucuronosyltransferase 2B1-like [Lingula anatina]|eukprot:XP_013379512.1 UDP-glucuronosyltransferase 2B1-like [Lingula anatina]